MDTAISTKKRARASEAALVEQSSGYNLKIAAEICSELVCGDTGLLAICERNKGKYPAYRTVRLWIAEQPQFQEMFLQAKRAQILLEVDSLTDTIRGEEDVNRARLLVDTTKWKAGKLLPKLFGEKVELTGQNGGPINHSIEVKFI